MSTFERYLTLWVSLCIVAGVAAGHFAPGLFRAIGAIEIARVNLPVAVLIWAMIVPMLLRIDFAALGFPETVDLENSAPQSSWVTSVIFRVETP